MDKNKNETAHVYALFHSWIWRLSVLFFPFIGIVWMVFGVVAFFPPFHKSFGDSLATTIIGLVVLILMTRLYRALGQTRLVVTPDGMTYYTLGYRMYTPWNNVLGIEPFRPYPFTLLHTRTFSGFRLRQKYRIHLKLEDGRQQQIAVLETDWWNPAWSMTSFAYRFPLLAAIVGHNWQEREFGRDVRQYAPWVLQALPRQSKSEM